MAYEPGDHVGIFPANREEIVDGIIRRLSGVSDPEEMLQLQVLKEKQTQNGNLCHTMESKIFLYFSLSGYKCLQVLGTA